MDTLDHLADLAAAALSGPLDVPEGTAIVAACSGGADSVALVEVLHRLRARWPLRGVVHVDHGLRDGSADRAAAEAAARRAEAPCSVVTLPAGALHGNLQAAARAARYDALFSLTPPGALVATGHTADDQTETLLMRIARGTGIAGLRGIRPREGRLVRPLLAATRAETRAAVAGLHVDDPSNDTLRFTRNRLRAEVVPPLLALHPELHGAAARLRDAAAGEIALVEALLTARVPPLDSLPELALAALLGHLSRRLEPDLPASHMAATALAARIRSGATAASVTLGNGLRAEWQGGRLALGPDRDPRREASLQGPGRVRLGGLTVQLTPAGASAEADRPASAAFALGDDAWPISLRDTGEGPPAVDIRDRHGVLVWPEADGVSTLRKSSGVRRVFRIATRSLGTLTVERDGNLRLVSGD
jgi:tRNA(Ile)-lysidine synthase